MRPRGLLTLLTTLALLLAACSGGGEEVEGEGLEDTADDEPTAVDTGTGDDTEPADDGAAPTGGTVIAAISAEPDQLDPHLTTASPSFTINEQVYETLVQTTTDLTFEPELATDWEQSDDGLTWTFNLRDDVTFHNGEPFTADDVVFSIERVMDDETGAANQFRTTAIDSVTAVDDTTVEFALSEPAPNLLANLSNGGLAIVEQSTVEDGTIESDPVGTGPFVFDSYTQGSSVQLSANPDHWDGAPSIEGVEFRFISEGTTALTALQTGEIHWTDNIPPQNVAEILASDELESGSVPSTDYWYLAYNFDRAPFDDPQVREALTIAFDREAVRDAAHFDAATVNQTAIPPSSFWYYDYAPFEYDPDRARTLLEEAGATDLSLGLLVSSEFPQTVQVAQVLESQWSDIGVDVTIESVEFATWLDRNDAGDFDVKMLGWLGNIDPNDYYYSQHVTDGANNTQSYSNEEVDELLDQARTETDQDARKQLYDQAAKIIVDDMSYVYLYNPDIVQAWVPSLGNYEVRADGQILFKDVTLG